MTGADTSEPRPWLSFRRAAEALTRPAPGLFADLFREPDLLLVAPDLLQVSLFGALPETPSTASKRAAHASGAGADRDAGSADPPRARVRPDGREFTLGSEGSSGAAPNAAGGKDREHDDPAGIHSRNGGARGTRSSRGSHTATEAGARGAARHEEPDSARPPTPSAALAADRSFAAGAGFGHPVPADEPVHWTHLLERIRTNLGEASAPSRAMTPGAHPSRSTANRDAGSHASNVSAPLSGDHAAVAPAAIPGAEHSSIGSLSQPPFAPRTTPPAPLAGAKPRYSDAGPSDAFAGNGVGVGGAGAPRGVGADPAPAPNETVGREQPTITGDGLISIVNEALVEQARRYGVDLR